MSTEIEPIRPPEYMPPIEPVQGCDLTQKEAFEAAEPLEAASPPAEIDDTIAGSEDALSVRFAQENVHRLRYDEMRGWVAFVDDRRWQEVTTPAIWNLLAPLVREVARSLDGLSAKDRRKLAGRGTVAGSEALARGRLLVRRDIWDVDPFLLNTPAGIVDLRTGELGPSAPEAYCMKMTAYGPADDEDCPTWKRYLGEATGGNPEFPAYLRRLIGYALIGKVIEHLLVFMYGTGGNGKGTLLETVGAILGDYAQVAPIALFVEKNGEQHPTGIARLAGARFVRSQETDKDRYWDEAMIMALTGGDQLTGRFMRQDFFDFWPSHTLVIAGNHKPKLKTVNDAAKRRLHVVPFTITPAAIDTGLREKLLAEAPGILRWAINGCLEYLGEDFAKTQTPKGLLPPAVVTDFTAEYFADQDPLDGWLATCLRDPFTWTPRPRLFENYREYVRQHPDGGWSVNMESKFYSLLESHGFLQTGRNGLRGFTGIGLPTAADNVVPLKPVPPTPASSDGACEKLW